MFKISRSAFLSGLALSTSITATTYAAPFMTAESPMMQGRNGATTQALLTVGEFVDDGNGGSYQLPGITDGMGAFLADSNTVRVFINHEFRAGQGAAFTLANGTVMNSGARVSSIDIDKTTRKVIKGEQAIKSIVNYAGLTVDATNVASFGDLNRLCSSAMFGSKEGFDRNVYITGEESGGGRGFVMDADAGVMYEVPAFGYGAWENMTVLPTAGTAAEDKTVILLADDSEKRPMYMFVGDKNPGSTDFLEKNGLGSGQLYVFVPDDNAGDIPNTNEEFQGTGNSVGGKWVPIATPAAVGTGAEREAAMNAMVAEAEAAGAFLFSRPEDLAYNPLNPSGGEAVFASTGRLVDDGIDYDNDGDTDVIDDPWGTTYKVQVDLDTLVGGGEVTGGLNIFKDHNETEDFGVRSPDNLDWADNGDIFLQEDRSIGLFGQTSGREASIWMWDANRGMMVQVAEMDRSAVPAGQTDGDPTDIGDWESSGIIDISDLFEAESGSLLLFNVQAHSIRDGVIAENNLVQGGQILFLDTTGVVPEPTTISLAGMAAGVLLLRRRRQA